MFPTRSKALALGLAATLLGGVLAAPPALAVGDILDVHRQLPDVDPKGSILPGPAQKTAVKALGAQVRWNEFGTPASLIDFDGFLGRGQGSDAVGAARAWVSEHAGLFRMTGADVDALEVASVNPLVGSGARVVVFRQSFGDLPAIDDGLISVGVTDDHRIAYVSSSVAEPADAPSATIDELDAVGVAAADVDLSVPEVTPAGKEHGWSVYDTESLSHPLRVRLGAVPTPTGPRPAYEVLLIHDDIHGTASGYEVYVDARTRQVITRNSIVDQLADNPRWKVYKNIPPISYRSRDRRIVQCWEAAQNGTPVQGCDMEVKNPAAELAWDVDPTTGQPSFTTIGNAASTSLSSISPFTPSDNYRPVSPEREYIYPWTNYWHEEKCPRQNFSPDMERNDINGAIVNLFAMHNRIHDWSYKLGFTEENFNLQQSNFGAQAGREGDPEVGNAQAAMITGGAPTYTGRDNANQITPPDGVSPITNMYLWQPAAGAFYPPCVDGDFDMSVIGHEYTHAISNRMVGGADGGLDERQGGSMGESWSDLDAVEYLFEHNYAPVGNENPYAVGPYVTGNKQTGIRNFAMNRSPLNYSDVGYDLTGAQVHADGEIWSATNFAIRKAMMKKYNRRFPAQRMALQRKCAEGTREPSQCPGNRRWIQIVYDAWLLMQSDVVMLDARDAYLAADKMRFNSRNKKVLWKVFAQRGFGAGAKKGREEDTDDIVKPSFKSPAARNEGVLRFRAVSGGKRVKAKVFVGRFEARVTPVADTNRKTKRKARVQMMPGRYSFVAKAKGYGMFRFSKKVRPNSSKRITLRMQPNWASRSRKAKATGQATEAGPAAALIDDTEATNWTFTGPEIRGAAITVNLAGGAHRVRRINVSAMLRPRQVVAGQGDPQDPSQNRFTALRSFRIEACKASKTNQRCSVETGFKTVYTSPRNAFPARAPRPISPKLIMKTFKIPATRATHLRLVVLTNQCTGTKAFHGDQDSDATNDTDCRSGSAQDESVRVAELQVFSRPSRARS